MTENNYYIDSHAHIHEPWFKYADLPKLISKTQEQNVQKIVNCASDPSNFMQVINSLDFDEIYATFGIQPTLANTLDNADELRELFTKLEMQFSLVNHKVRAIGEVGMDFYWVKEEKLREKQKVLFIDAIDLANDRNLPLVIHSRKAEAECLDVLKKHAEVPVLMHSFEGNLQLMERVRDLGYLVSIPTNVVIRKSRRKVAKRVGLEKLMLETDSPYCAPSDDLFPNTPATIPQAAAKLAEVLETDIEEIMRVTTRNTRDFYKI